MRIDESRHNQHPRCVEQHSLGMFVAQPVEIIGDVQESSVADNDVQPAATVARITGENSAVGYDRCMCHDEMLLSFTPGCCAVLFVFHNDTHCFQGVPNLVGKGVHLLCANVLTQIKNQSHQTIKNQRIG